MQWGGEYYWGPGHINIFCWPFNREILIPNAFWKELWITTLKKNVVFNIFEGILLGLADSSFPNSSGKFYLICFPWTSVAYFLKAYHLVMTMTTTYQKTNTKTTTNTECFIHHWLNVCYAEITNSLQMLMTTGCLRPFAGSGEEPLPWRQRSA